MILVSKYNSLRSTNELGTFQLCILSDHGDIQYGGHLTFVFIYI